MRFDNYNNNWVEYKLKDFSIKIKEKNKDCQHDTVLSNSAKNGIVLQKDFFDKNIANKDNIGGYYVVNKEDFIYNPRISNSAPVGPINKNNTDKIGVVSPLYTVFRVNKDINKTFLEYFFKSTKWHRYIKGVANYGARFDRINITQKDLFNLPIKMPSKDEQEKIATFLSTIDRKIALMEKKHLIYKNIENFFIQNLLNSTSYDLKNPSLRFNGFTKDWKISNLEKLSIVKDGTHDSPKYVEEGYPLVTSKNLNENGIIDYENVNYISKEDFDNINKRSKVDIGDILFGMIGTIGNPVIIDKNDFAIKNVALIKEQTELKNNFLIYYLRSNDILKQFYKFNAGGTQKFIALNLIKNLSIKYPELTEQEKIHSFLTTISNKVMLINKEINVYKKFKVSLLAKMFC